MKDFFVKSRYSDDVFNHLECDEWQAKHGCFGGGKGGGSSGTTVTSGTTTTTNEPWSGAQPYITDVLSEAQNLYRDLDKQYYPGLTVANFSPVQEAAYAGILNQANANNPIAQAATGQVVNTLSGAYTNPALSGDFQLNSPAAQQLMATSQGQYLGSNPYTDALYSAASAPIIEQFNEQLIPGMTSQFTRSGRSNSPAQQFQTQRAGEAVGRTLNDLATQIYGGAYESERGRQDAATQALDQAYRGDLGLASQAFQAERQNQLGALQQAGTADALNYANLDRIANVGTAQQALQQNVLNDALTRYLYNQQAPYDELQQYASTVLGLPSFSTSSGQTTQTQPVYSNPASGVLGGLLGLGALGSLFG